MAASKKGLGKGLSALMAEDYSQVTAGGAGDAKSDASGAPRELSPELLISGRYQPRTRFNDDYLRELADSIRRNGIMQPIIVRQAPRAPKDREAKYEIIAGERRWRAAKLAGLDQVPVIIRDIDDKQALELALVENIQRQDLAPLEEASGYQRLMDEFSYTQEELSSTVGKSRSHIANLLRLLGLPEAIRQHLDNDRITMGHARALLGADDPEALVEEVIRRGLNVRQTENLARGGLNPSAKKNGGGRRSGGTSRRGDKDPDILALEETLSENLGLTVSIDDHGQEGQIILSYTSLSQLDDILKRLGGAI